LDQKEALKHSPPEVKRTASLQRRGFFDFVSPLTVYIAVAGYFLSAAFVIYVQHEVPGFSGYRLLRTITLVFVLNAFALYWLMFRRKKWPLEPAPIACKRWGHK
jgi:hypothetical protein